MPQPVSASPRADPWPEKPSRSQQRRRQRKNSKAKAAAAREGAGAGAGAGAAPAMVLQLEQLLMLPPQPMAQAQLAQPAPQLLMAEVVPVTGMVLPAPLVMPMQPPLAPPAPAAAVAPAGEAAEVGTTQWSPPEVTPERRRRQRSRAPLPPRSGRQWRGRRSVEVEDDMAEKRRTRDPSWWENHGGQSCWVSAKDLLPHRVV